VLWTLTVSVQSSPCKGGHDIIKLSIGVSNDEIIKYETALKADKYLLMVHGTTAEIAEARTVLGH
jgi:hypothetical protein